MFSRFLVAGLLSISSVLITWHSAESSENDYLCKVLRIGCSSGSFKKSNQAYAASSDTTGNNPASVNTDKTPWGVEALKGLGPGKIGLFKGYGSFGLAGGNLSRENSFFSNVSNHRVKNVLVVGIDPATTQAGYGEDINQRNYLLATGFSLVKGPKDLNLVFGIGGRHYIESKRDRLLAGLSLANAYFHLGLAGGVYESNNIVYTSNIGVRFFNLSLDFSYLENHRAPINRTRICTAIYDIGIVSLIGAYRQQTLPELSSGYAKYLRASHREVSNSHAFFGTQVALNPYISVAYYYNHVLQNDQTYAVRLTFGHF